MMAKSKQNCLSLKRAICLVFQIGQVQIHSKFIPFKIEIVFITIVTHYDFISYHVDLLGLHCLVSLPEHCHKARC